MNTTPVQSGATGSTVADPGRAPGNGVAPGAHAVALPEVVRPETVKAPQSPIEYSPGVAELSPAERRAAFLAASKKPEPEPEPKETTGETQPENGPESAPEKPAEEEEEEAKPADKGAPEDPDTDLVSGLAKHAEKHPELKGLLARTQKVLKQNSERKAELDKANAELEALRARPVNVLKPEPAAPLAHLTTEAEVEAEVTTLVTEANTLLRWLVKHEDEGGVWDEGGPNEQPMTAKEVASAIAYYEGIRDGGARQMGDARKAWLASYADTLKELKDVKAEELEDPKSPEGKFLKAVPEMRRDASFLRLLADAKAGRELREEAAKGITRVKVEPGKAKAPVKPSDTTQEAERPPAAQAPREEPGDEDERAAIRRAFVKRAA